MSIIEITLIGLAVLIALLIIGMPIAFALSIAGILGILMIDGFDIALYSLGNYPFAFMKSWLLVAVPLFILMGFLANTAGVTDKAFSAGYKWLGQLPGGLAMASIAACAAFAATSGSSVATAGMVGAVAIPEMIKYGYDKRLASGAVAAGGLLGILIPPSIPFVLYGFITNTSIGKLLLSGIIPGILTAIAYCLCIFILTKYNPKIAGKIVKYSWGDRIRSLKDLSGIAGLFLIVVVGIYGGLLTPTEAAAAGAALALILSFKKNFSKLGEILKAFTDTGKTTGMILGICIGASLFTQFLSLTDLPNWLEKTVKSFGTSPIVILIFVLACYIPLGMFLDTISMLFITLPIFFPIITSAGIDPILFGVLVVKLEEVSLITPPVGINVYVIKGVADDIPLNDIFIGTLPFMITEFAVIAMLIAFPQICLWLPNTMMGN